MNANFQAYNVDAFIRKCNSGGRGIFLTFPCIISKRKRNITGLFPLAENNAYHNEKRSFYPCRYYCIVGCCRPEENTGQLKATNQSLEYANGILQDANNLIYEELAVKQKDPATAGYADKWGLKANRIKLYADSIKDLIKNIKSDLIMQSDGLKKEYVTVVKQLYDGNGVGAQLLNKLVTFKDSFPTVIYLGENIMAKEDRIRACYQHCSLMHVSGQITNN